MEDGIEAPPAIAKTLSVPEAGRRYFGFGRAASYAAAARGDLPVIRLGRNLRVSIPALEEMLRNAGRRAA
jgi:hypothetical protein